MKRVYICSNILSKSYVTRKKNLQMTRIYCRLVWEKGYFPIAPHLYLKQFLDDEDKNERKEAMRIDLQVLEQCAEMWVFGKVISWGMQEEIEQAKRLNLPIRYFNQYGEEEPL